MSEQGFEPTTYLHPVHWINIIKLNDNWMQDTKLIPGNKQLKRQTSIYWNLPLKIPKYCTSRLDVDIQFKKKSSSIV